MSDWWLIALVIFLIAIKIYNFVTCGVCKCRDQIAGKVAIVTGSNTGIGYETARDLARRGARIILACRDIDKALRARKAIIDETGNKQIVYMYLDLASNDSVRQFVDRFLRNQRRLDILINNAGAAAIGNRRNDEGILLEMQINHYGPFLLTNLLLPIMKESAPSRIINVSSFSHWTAIPSLKWFNSYIPIQGMVYANTKLCNILFTKELSRRLEGTGVTVNSLHPGLVVSDIYRNANFLVRYFSDAYNKFLFKSTWEGAQTSIYLAVSPDVERVTGTYFTDCKPGWESWTASNEKLAKELWEYSEKYVKLDKSDKSAELDKREIYDALEKSI